jgi:hypothetical protein
MCASIKNTERPRINDLILHVIFLEKEKQAKSITSKRRKIKTRADINK